MGVVLWLTAIFAFHGLGTQGWPIAVLVATAFMGLCFGIGLALLRWKADPPDRS